MRRLAPALCPWMPACAHLHTPRPHSLGGHFLSSSREASLPRPPQPTIPQPHPEMQAGTFHEMLGRLGFLSWCHALSDFGQVL